MDVFAALADPTRRKILELLAIQGKMTASQISQNFAMSPPAVSQHLKILREADLVQVEKRAQQRIYQINPAAMQLLEDWVRQMREQWSQRLDRLEQVLRAEKPKNKGEQ